MGSFRISGIEIDQIGPFGHLKLKFPEKPPGFSNQAEIHILTGENGTGKTTVLEMLTASVTKRPLSNKLRDKGEDAGINISFSKGSFTWRRHSKSYLSEPLLDTFLQLYDTKSLSDYPLAFFAYSGYRRIEPVSIATIEESGEYPFEDVLNFQRPDKPQLILQWIANSIAKEAIAKSQSDGPAQQKFRQAISNLENAISGIIERPIHFRLAYDPLNVVIGIEDEILKFDQLPDGLKSIISWIADLLMRMDRVKWKDDTPIFERNFILFLDEIEVHLHPAWQRKILPAVQKLFPNAQIFISTHSPFVVGSVDGAWIHKFVKPNGDSRLAGPPVLSEDANSFRYWLAEIFDLDQEFGGESQKRLDEFYALRDVFLANGNPSDLLRIQELAAQLSGQTPEMDAIISWELRQIYKRGNLQSAEL